MSTRHRCALIERLGRELAGAPDRSRVVIAALECAAAPARIAERYAAAALIRWLSQRATNPPQRWRGFAQMVLRIGRRFQSSA